MDQINNPNFSNSPNFPDHPDRKKAGYEYLMAYKITVPIYDYTVEFCGCWIPKNSRTNDQMVQAARSGMQNISEGNQQNKISGYIYLCGIARGSLEELLKDYHAFLRQNQMRIWSVGEIKGYRGYRGDRGNRVNQGGIWEVEEVWRILKATPTLSDHPNFPDIPDNPEAAANMMITLINQANFLIDKLIVSLKEKDTEENYLSPHQKRLKEAVQWEEKKDKDSYKEMIKGMGLVMTARGMMKKEEAESLGLEEIGINGG